MLNPNANLTPAQVERQFAALDTNKDGKLSKDEFNRPLVARRMDTNGDGFVTLEEAPKNRERRNAALAARALADMAAFREALEAA